MSCFSGSFALQLPSCHRFNRVFLSFQSSFANFFLLVLRSQYFLGLLLGVLLLLLLLLLLFSGQMFCFHLSIQAFENRRISGWTL